MMTLKKGKRKAREGEGEGKGSDLSLPYWPGLMVRLR